MKKRVNAVRRTSRVAAGGSSLADSPRRRRDRARSQSPPRATRQMSWIILRRVTQNRAITLLPLQALYSLTKEQAALLLHPVAQRELNS